MKNNFKFFLVYLTLSFGLFLNLNANEQFVFDVTEIEILENGNLIVGKKGGKVTVEDGSIITANDFKYNKILNILEAQGNVKFENEIEEIVIFSDNAIYNKNLEQLITKGNSKAIKIDGTNPTYYFDRGFFYLQLQEYQKAQGDFIKAIAYDHKDIRLAYFNLGISSYRLGQKDKACEQWRKSENVGMDYINKYCN